MVSKKTGKPARMIADKRFVFDDEFIVEMKLWEVPSPVPGSPHSFKYSLFFGVNGKRIVGYDNERGKGDHRHYEDVEQPYNFTDIDTLIEDFLADVGGRRP